MRLFPIILFFLFNLMSFDSSAQELRKICIRFNIEVGCVEWGQDLRLYDFRISTNIDDFVPKRAEQNTELQINDSIEPGITPTNHNTSMARGYGEGVAFAFIAFFDQYSKLKLDEQIIKDNFIAVKARVADYNRTNGKEAKRVKQSISSLKIAYQDVRHELDQSLDDKKQFQQIQDKRISGQCERIGCSFNNRYEQYDFIQQDKILSAKRDELLNLENPKLSRNTINNIYTLSGHLQTKSQEAYESKKHDDAITVQQVAMHLVNFGLDLTPGIGDGKAIYESIFGVNPVTGEILSNTDRVISGVSGAIGLATFGTLGGATKLLLKTSGHLTHLPEASKILQSSATLINKFGELGIKTVNNAKDFLASSAGKLWAKVQASGRFLDEAGHIVFDTKSKINNPLPSDGMFARVMPREFADLLVKGQGYLSRNEVQNGQIIKEAFVTAADDIIGLNADQLVRKLSLFRDEAATELVKLTNNDVIITFKYKDEYYQTLRSPIEVVGGRNYGYVSGGRTMGGAREWLVDNDIFLRGLIDMDSVKVLEIKL